MFPKITRSFTITEKASTRDSSWLKAPSSAFTFKTLLWHFAKQALFLVGAFFWSSSEHLSRVAGPRDPKQGACTDYLAVMAPCIIYHGTMDHRMIAKQTHGLGIEARAGLLNTWARYNPYLNVIICSSLRQLLPGPRPEEFRSTISLLFQV